MEVVSNNGIGAIERVFCFRVYVDGIFLACFFAFQPAYEFFAVSALGDIGEVYGLRWDFVHFLFLCWGYTQV